MIVHVILIYSRSASLILRSAPNTTMNCGTLSGARVKWQEFFKNKIVNHHWILSRLQKCIYIKLTIFKWCWAFSTAYEARNKEVSGLFFKISWLVSLNNVTM